jgi:hypothetical protein
MSRVAATILLLAAPALVAAQCPQVHVFGARETTVSPGYGTSGPVVNSILAAYSGSTAEAISYPACMYILLGVQVTQLMLFQAAVSHHAVGFNTAPLPSKAQVSDFDQLEWTRH